MQSNRWKQAAVAAAVLVALLGLLGVGRMGTASPLRNLFGIVLTPLQKGITSAAWYISDKLAVFTRYDALEQENEALRERVLELEGDLRELDRYRQENESLRAFSGVVERRRDFELEFAQVIARDPDNLYRTFTIDKGSLDDVSRYDAVITPQGLVGLVTEVGLTYAKVTSLLDELTPIGAVVSRTRDMGLLEHDGDLAAEGLARVNYLPGAYAASPGDSVETSGLGGMFPSGVVIGTVREVLPESHNISSYAVVEPAVDFTHIRYVMVVRAFEQPAAESQEEAQP